MIIASDGFWDILTPNDACGFVKFYMENKT